jgi:hypothetical protein
VLFKETFTVYSPAQSQYSCGNFVSRIVYPPNYPVDTAPAFILNEFDGTVSTLPGVRENLGMYPLAIESCIRLVGGNQEIRCTTSDAFRVEVTDPCPYTDILPSIFTKVLQAPRLRTDELTIASEIGPAWPWISDLDMTYAGAYGPALCGPIEYEVFYDNQG